MPSRIDELLARIAQLEREVEIELSHARAECATGSRWDASASSATCGWRTTA